MTAAWCVALWVSTPPMIFRARLVIWYYSCSVGECHRRDGHASVGLRERAPMRSHRTGETHGQHERCRPARPTGPEQGTRIGPGNLRVDRADQHQDHHHWKLLSPERRRAAVHHLMTVMGVSERFACRVTGQNRTTQRHQAAGQTPVDPDAALRAWLHAYAKKHPRWGYRRAYHDARGEGWTMNHKKLQRIWREEGLRVPQRRRRKRLGTSTTATTPTASLDLS